MFEKYLATQKDLEAIEQGIDFVWRKELDFIFKDRSKIAKTLVISFDSKKMYVWHREEKGYKIDKIFHNIKIKDQNQQGWKVGLRSNELHQFFSQKRQVDWHERPKISGGLFVPFIELQKRKKREFNPYTTYESYLAAIVHEFGHIYYNQHKLHWYSNKKENLNYIEKARRLYQQEKLDLKNFKLKIPTPRCLTELFAFCTDYTVALIFWPKHKEDIDKYNIAHLLKLRGEESKKNLNTQDSVLDEDSHDFAAIMGKLLLEHYPKKWPEILLKGYDL